MHVLNARSVSLKYEQWLKSVNSMLCTFYHHLKNDLKVKQRLCADCSFKCGLQEPLVPGASAETHGEEAVRPVVSLTFAVKQQNLFSYEICLTFARSL